jgi:hypothetical protein
VFGKQICYHMNSFHPTGSRGRPCVWPQMAVSLTQIAILMSLLAARVAPADEPAREHPEKTSARLASLKSTSEGVPATAHRLTTQQGPWMIFAASFAGESAEEEALTLATEMRKRWRLPAYVYSERFDFSQPVQAIGLREDGTRLKLKHRLPIAYDEIAVLVGNFPAVNDPQLQKTLDFVKHVKSPVLEGNLQRERTSMRYAGLRSWQRRNSTDEKERKKGLMGQAFVTRNPLLPEEFFAPKGIDAMVASMNSGVEHSLLECPGNYSVRIAAFRGTVLIDQREVKEALATNRFESRLVEAAEKAHRLTEILRKRKVEAYLFHDRHESIVTVGSFESMGTPREDGMIEINPAIFRIIKDYSPQQQILPDGRSMGLMPKTIGGIALDIQPIAVAVPKRSVATDYRRSAR